MVPRKITIRWKCFKLAILTDPIHLNTFHTFAILDSFELTWTQLLNISQYRTCLSSCFYCFFKRLCSNNPEKTGAGSFINFPLGPHISTNYTQKARHATLDVMQYILYFTSFTRTYFSVYHKSINKSAFIKQC